MSTIYARLHKPCISGPSFSMSNRINRIKNIWRWNYRHILSLSPSQLDYKLNNYRVIFVYFSTFFGLFFTKKKIIYFFYIQQIPDSGSARLDKTAAAAGWISLENVDWKFDADVAGKSLERCPGVGGNDLPKINACFEPCGASRCLADGARFL